MVTTKKVDLKRDLPELYSATRRPGLVDVPELAFLMIDGHGDPNRAPEYAQAVEGDLYGPRVGPRDHRGRSTGLRALAGAKSRDGA
jgi:hypothetical protein